MNIGTLTRNLALATAVAAGASGCKAPEGTSFFNIYDVTVNMPSGEVYKIEGKVDTPEEQKAMDYIVSQFPAINNELEAISPKIALNVRNAVQYTRNADDIGGGAIQSRDPAQVEAASNVLASHGIFLSSRPDAGAYMVTAAAAAVGGYALSHIGTSVAAPKGGCIPLPDGGVACN